MMTLAALEIAATVGLQVECVVGGGIAIRSACETFRRILNARSRVGGRLKIIRGLGHGGKWVCR